MHEGSIVISRPDRPVQLVLLFHGVGSSAANLAPLGESIAQANPKAMVVSVDAPRPSTLGNGREWFSVVEITEHNRAERIAEVMPLFLQTVAQWQQESSVDPAATTLVGFSQGAIMSLESTQVEDASLPAHRVIALAGRLASPARRGWPSLQLNLVHGEQDTVVPAASSIAAAREMRALGANVTLDLLPGLGHGIDTRVVHLGVIVLFVQISALCEKGSF